jgi:hypothetical protein
MAMLLQSEQGLPARRARVREGGYEQWQGFGAFHSMQTAKQGKKL